MYSPRTYLMSHRNHIRRTYPIAVGGDADSKVWFPNWFLIWSIKKARSQLLGRRYRWDFWVPGEKGRCKEGKNVSSMLWRKKNAATM